MWNKNLPTINNKKELTNLNFKLKKVTFEDQFWNEVQWVSCQCWKVWLLKDYTAYTNYWVWKRKIFLCDSCLKEIQKVTDRVQRKSSDINDWVCESKEKGLWWIPFKR